MRPTRIRDFIMKKLKLLLPFVSILFIICFYSCDKSKDNSEQLERTTWESSYFKGKFYGRDCWIEVECDKVTISFNTGKKADITFQNCVIAAPDMNWGSMVDLYDNSSNYTLKGKTITLKPKFTVPFSWAPIPEQNWTGEMIGERMTLKNVFGKTVDFRKLK